jgi:hypothetical protein
MIKILAVLALAVIAIFSYVIIEDYDPEEGVNGYSRRKPTA